MKKKYNLYRLIPISDNRGEMCVLESMNQIPFTINRIFYDYNNIDSLQKRGCHANINSKFAFICLNGSCSIDVDDGFNRDTFILNSPNYMLIIENMVWKQMYNFSKDSILLVISDCKYDKNEYINDYNTFIERIKK